MPLLGSMCAQWPHQTCAERKEDERKKKTRADERGSECEREKEREKYSFTKNSWKPLEMAWL